MLSHPQIACPERLVWRSLVGAMLGVLLVACGTDAREFDPSPADPAAPDNTGATGDGGASANGAAPSNAGGPSAEMASATRDPALSAAEGEVSPLGDGAVCLSESRGMEPSSLALYLMLDSSGSMLEPAGALTKWEAVQRALGSFITRSEGSALALGLQFFPLNKPGVRSFVCTSHDDCGPEGGPCFLSTCLQGGTITLCRTDADCPVGDQPNPCIPFGLCANSDAAAPTACVLPSTCGSGLGACEDFERTCTNGNTCEPGAYATPAVEIQALSTGASAITRALAGKSPEGLTPTVPALQGAVDHARAWALTHPAQQVAVVLITDGLPTDCGTPAPGSLPALDQTVQIAAAALSSSPPIRTHVIGVFAEGDAASAAGVGAIAAAGGTEVAAVVDSSGAIEQQFSEALRNVGGSEGPCQLLLGSAEGVDFSRVDLTFDAGDGTSPSPLPYASGLVGCASEPDGWYYDVPPAQGTPEAVTLCPGLCDIVRAAPAARLSLELGCAAP